MFLLSNNKVPVHEIVYLYLTEHLRLYVNQIIVGNSIDI